MRLRDVSNQMPSAEDFLNALGLEMRRSNSESMLSSLAIFAGGVTVGAAVVVAGRVEQRISAGSG
jgi:hypothetical protein